MRRLTLLVALLPLAFAATALAGPVYTWKDAKGVTHYADAPPQYFQSLAFNDDAPKGEVRYHNSFSAASH